VELKKTNSGVVAEHKKMEAISVDAARRTDALRSEVTELTNLVKSRDATAAALRERNVAQEAEVEKLRVRVDNLQKDRDSWKGKALNNSSEEEEMLRVSTWSRHGDSLFANHLADLCPMQRLPQQLQRHDAQDVRSPVLPVVC
jgi:uncharacterized protein YjcR